MTYHNLLIADQGAIRTITINRPDKLNALNQETITELQHIFDQSRHDNTVRVIILAGSGEKAFVAGADIAELNQLSPFEAQHFSRAGQRLMLSIESLGKPVIARIQGFALGGGMEIAMSCHLRIGSEKAKLGQPEINLGIIPGFGGTQRLLRIAGRSAALELCMVGAPMDAQRAYQLGVLNRVVAPENLDAEIQGIAQQLALSAPLALAGILDAILVGGECGLEAGLDYETKAFALCCASQDKTEGTTAFLERRKPNFNGK